MEINRDMLMLNLAQIKFYFKLPFIMHNIKNTIDSTFKTGFIQNLPMCRGSNYSYKDISIKYEEQYKWKICPERIDPYFINSDIEKCVGMQKI